jgi:hypothetical protein
MDDGITLIESCKRLYMHQIDEPEANVLRLVIVEAVSGTRYIKSDHDIFELQEIFRDAKQIIHESGSKIFELNWVDYVAYSVRNESYVMKDDYEVFEGHNFVKYTKSRYLDFVEKATFAGDRYHGLMTHWGIFCLNHIVDVVSSSEPTWQFSVAK